MRRAFVALDVVAIFSFFWGGEVIACYRVHIPTLN